MNISQYHKLLQKKSMKGKKKDEIATMNKKVSPQMHLEGQKGEARGLMMLI